MRVFAFCLLPFAFLAAGCRPAAAPVSISNRPVSVNNLRQTNLPMPPVKNIENLGWQLADGKPQTFGEMRGKAVVLDFWATYCPPCLEEIPHLAALKSKYPELQIVGLHVGGAEDRVRVPAFIEKLKMNYPLAYPQDELTDVLFGGDDSIPQTFVFDREGKLVAKIVGFDGARKIALDKAIEQALKQ